ncbi:MAG: tetratricopeptide repeat protein [Taibaiella sp.]|nr:tetratricopeptide repeat protein [Taibaiella sp.]
MNPLSPGRKTKTLHFLVIVLAVWAVWSIALQATFLSWDDGAYTIANPDVQGLKTGNLTRWFTNYYLGNYHPFTMASLAVDYRLGANDPLIYHLSAIILHLVNSLLVYVLVSRLQKNSWVSLLTALLFAVHPVQSESVMWIAERKTLLAGTFSLCAMISYTGHLTAGRRILPVYLWCVAAMLSKGTAVMMPVSLLAIDIWVTGTIKQRALLDKLPLLACSLFFGIVAIRAQSSGGFLPSPEAASYLERIVVAGYALSGYVVHMIYPIGLSAIYPYPKDLTVVHFAGLFFALGYISATVWLISKKRIVLGAGMLFFALNMLPVLQLLRFGEALMADRYLYLACLGLFYPTAYALMKFKGNTALAVRAATGAIVCMLAVVTVNRNKHWLNDDTFFSTLLTQHPHSPVALYSAGIMRMRSNDLDAAELLMERAVSKDPRNYKAWYNKGMLHIKQGRRQEAMHALSESISLARYPRALVQRGLLYVQMGSLADALTDAEGALGMEPGNARGWYLKATALEKLGKQDSALLCYEKAIQYRATEPAYYIGHALALEHIGRNKEALGDLEKATAMAPKNADAHYYLGILQYESGISPCRELQSAAALGLLRARQALSRLCN